jgi:D-inositol-3-phosphate glycosyltransferase
MRTPNTMVRLLFYATHPNQPIGYSKVANILSNYLASFDNIELFYMGIHNNADTALHRFIDQRIQFIDVGAEQQKRESSDEYGVDIVETVIRQVKPDIFFIYNDIIVTCRLLNALLEYRTTNTTMKVFSYLDLVYPFERNEYVQHVNRNTDLIFVFSECWRKNLAEMRVDSAKIRVLPHGFNEHVFREMSRSEARAILGIAADDFVFLNTNRNTYRKALDITVSAFIQLLAKENFDPRLKLYMNCQMVVANGYDLMEVIETECLRRGIPMERVVDQILIPNGSPGNVSDDMVNAMYCGADVGLNTCTGEGFGLCNMEHAALGAPQIISDVGALHDIFGGGGAVLVKPKVSFATSKSQDGHGGIQYMCSAEDFCESMQHYFRCRELCQSDGLALKQRIREVYVWPKILAEFRAHILPYLI